MYYYNLIHTNLNNITFNDSLLCTLKILGKQKDLSYKVLGLYKLELVYFTSDLSLFFDLNGTINSDNFLIYVNNYVMGFIVNDFYFLLRYLYNNYFLFSFRFFMSKLIIFYYNIYIIYLSLFFELYFVGYIFIIFWYKIYMYLNTKLIYFILIFFKKFKRKTFLAWKFKTLRGLKRLINFKRRRKKLKKKFFFFKKKTNLSKKLLVMFKLLKNRK